MNVYDTYMKEITQQVRGELAQNGLTNLETSEEVSGCMNQVNADDTTFVVINSTCDCAAKLARPAAVAVATQNEHRPTNTVTVFAGQDEEATATMREFIQQVPPDPSYALFKDRDLVYFMPREFIEGRSINGIATDLKGTLDENCKQYTQINIEVNTFYNIKNGVCH